MKKHLCLAALLSSLWLQSAYAAVDGWYQLSAAWRDGSFTGQFYYDSTSPFQVTQISGTLSDLAQITAINSVWNTGYPDASASVFVTNAAAGQPDVYDAGFYLNVVNQGGHLSLNVLADNGLYDWSRDALYTPAQLDDSPLRGFSISPAPLQPVSAVPEPDNLIMLGLGLAVCAAMARRRARCGTRS